ncbi:MAG TPA: hypothetical protein VK425_12555 [Acidimicrobiales bacterium]|nr:hypothetical protein [Acidimicrobiales bacterium]
MIGLFVWALSTLIGGLIIGGLGRLVAPGRHPIGFWATALCGIGGALIGGAVAALLFGGPVHHWLSTLVLEVLAAAGLVSLVARRRWRGWA